MLSKESKIINVGIAEIVAAKISKYFKNNTWFLYRCVLYQPDLKIGAISHIMLAKDTMGRDKIKILVNTVKPALPKNKDNGR